MKTVLMSGMLRNIEVGLVRGDMDTGNGSHT